MGVSLEVPYRVVEEVASVFVAELVGRVLNCPLLSDVEDVGLDCG